MTMGKFRIQEGCPKCGHEGTFDIQYLRTGTERFPDVGRNVPERFGEQPNWIAVGPCMIKTCRVCSYTYTTPPADGEGTEKTDGRGNTEDDPIHPVGYSDEFPG